MVMMCYKSICKSAMLHYAIADIFQMMEVMKGLVMLL